MKDPLHFDVPKKEPLSPYYVFLFLMLCIFNTGFILKAYGAKAAGAFFLLAIVYLLVKLFIRNCRPQFGNKMTTSDDGAHIFPE